MTADESNPADSRTFRLTVPRLAESVALSRRRRLGREPQAPAHGRRAAERGEVVGEGRAAVVHEAPGRARARTRRGSRRGRARRSPSRITAEQAAEIGPPGLARDARRALGRREDDRRGARPRRTARPGPRRCRPTSSGHYAFVLEDEHASRIAPSRPAAWSCGPTCRRRSRWRLGRPEGGEADDLLVDRVLAPRRPRRGVGRAALHRSSERDARADAEEGRRDVAARRPRDAPRPGRGVAESEGAGLQAGRCADLPRPGRRQPPRAEGAERHVLVARDRWRSSPRPSRCWPASGRIERQTLQDQFDAIKKAAAENRQEAEALRYAADAAQRGNGKWDDERQADARPAARRPRGRSSTSCNCSPATSPTSGQFAAAGPAREADRRRRGRGRPREARRRPPGRTTPRRGSPSSRGRRPARRRAGPARRAAAPGSTPWPRLDDDRRKLRELAERQEELAEARRGARRRRRSRRAGEAPAGAGPPPRRARRARPPLARAEGRGPRRPGEAGRRTSPRRPATWPPASARRPARRPIPPAAPTKLKALAEAQRQLEDDARRLAMQVDRPLEENGRGRLNPPRSPDRRADRARRDRAGPPAARRGRGRACAGSPATSTTSATTPRPWPAGSPAARTCSTTRSPRPSARRSDPDAEEGRWPRRSSRWPIARRPIPKLAAAIPVPTELKDQAKEAVQAIERSRDDLKSNKNRSGARAIRTRRATA